MLDTVYNICFIIMTLALLLSSVRLLKGPSLPDRVVALELMASITVGLVVLYSIAHSEPKFIDVAIVLALTSFLAAVGFSRYLEQRGIREDD
ncbi:MULTISPECIES: monovalent cation/H+ antiporter complex subunit F [Vibrio]|uniref:pH regulation protein F n=2 Tax=Vibrio genomosp. F10 TaxID=723171 RepID=A0A1B9QWF5_9VIBR|nr:MULTISPECIES: cation:proton antiporter [Vibrio]OCH73976.1 pH regulation protein F [Vibrio genomosp. F10]OEE32641.1 pH regulation protein F [Vibrio genomosp. F10 str. ZF-129]OEE91898.1 pH regulation protein F [Vibrio genomosp. F10 str. 9ZD137]OEE98393.1 pH regulation protein F [Vibrio genomosp. F10 str. 9ZC157]OEF07635.1 pH regulation protein F [Vibrio genomosp. F10 str. 9ZB36]